MRAVLPFLLALTVIGCAADPERNAAALCAAQGHQPGTEAWRHCAETGGAAIATGPGSPYANADQESGDSDD